MTAADGGFRESGLSPEQLAWGVPSPPRSYWPARAAIVVSIVLYLLLPERLLAGPRYVIPVVELAVLLVLSVVFPHHTHVDKPLRREMALLLIALVSTVNVVNLALLLRVLLQGSVNNGRELVLASTAIWLTNVIVFGLWYWELDRGGPRARHDADHREPDFLFPQMTTPGSAPTSWAPAFIDYLYLSFTNATAFSPTDTMPMTVMAKALMGVQSFVSLLTVAVVAARAVNILS